MFILVAQRKLHLVLSVKTAMGFLGGLSVELLGVCGGCTEADCNACSSGNYDCVGILMVQFKTAQDMGGTATEADCNA